MPRSRNIKPAFFTNDDLAEIDPLGRLLFIGLWCIADRDGRLEDRPKRIKAELLPYDVCHVVELLDGLSARGFIERFEVDGTAYIQVTNFSKHQNPHKNEKPSEIPAPPDSAAKEHETNTGVAPDKDGARTVQASEKHRSGPADSLNLIPDSGLRMPNCGLSNSEQPKGKFVKPTIEQISEYCRERANRINPQKFWDHYEANGWNRGKTPMKDWKAAVRTWESNDYENTRSKSGRPLSAFERPGDLPDLA